MKMPPPPPSRQTRGNGHSCPPPPRKPTAPPAPPKSREQAEYELLRSYVSPFCEGRFDQIPPPYLAQLYYYCEDMGKPEQTVRPEVTEDDLMRATFVFTDFPFCSWAEASRQLSERIFKRTPFTAISRECLEWLGRELDFNAAVERRRKLAERRANLNLNLNSKRKED